MKEEKTQSNKYGYQEVFLLLILKSKIVTEVSFLLHDVYDVKIQVKEG